MREPNEAGILEIHAEESILIKFLSRGNYEANSHFKGILFFDSILLQHISVQSIARFNKQMRALPSLAGTHDRYYQYRINFRSVSSTSKKRIYFILLELLSF